MTLPYSVSSDLLPVSASPTFSMRILPFAATLVNGTFATAFAVIVALLTSAEMIYGFTVESSFKYTVPTGISPEVPVPSSPVVSSAILFLQSESE